MKCYYNYNIDCSHSANKDINCDRNIYDNNKICSAKK